MKKRKHLRPKATQLATQIVLRIKKLSAGDELIFNQFAGDALRGLLSQRGANICDRETICRLAWRYAQEMLRQKHAL